MFVSGRDAAMMHQSIAEAIEFLYKHQLHAFTLSLSYHYSMCSWQEHDKALHYSSQAALICFNSKRFKEGTAFVRNCLRFVLTKKDVLSLLLVVECGISQVEDYVKTSTPTPQQQQQPLHEGQERVEAAQAGGHGPPAGVLSHRQQLMCIRERLYKAYMSLGTCATLMRLPRFFFWLFRKLGRPAEGADIRVHAMG
jgi:hypothetical protein